MIVDLETIRKEYLLTAATCDEISGQIVAFCSKIQVDSKDTARYRLSAEECLLHWMENGLEGNATTLQMGSRFGAPYIVLIVEGPRDNPNDVGDEGFGPYCGSLLVNLNLKPEYSHSNGRNRVLFRLKRKPLNSLAVLGLTLVIALATGFLGLLLPEGIRETLLSCFLQPVYDAFLNALECIAGPMIFFSVVWGICGIGDVETFGRIGKRLILRDFGAVLLAACIAALSFPLLGPGFTQASIQSGELSDIMELALGIVPPNIVDPFASGNMLQIIVMAVMVGFALLYLGRRTEALSTVLEQANTLVGFVMEAICKLVPLMIILVVVTIIWTGALSTLASLWSFFAVYLAVVLFTATVFVLNTAHRCRVSPGLLIKKSTDTFMMGLSTASETATFNTNVATCERKFGIDSSIVGFGLPLGIAIHCPMLTIYYLLILFFFAGEYSVACTPLWLMTSMLVAIVMAIASPPFPGGGAVVYTLLFSQMGIPIEAVAVALAVDVNTDYIEIAFEQSLIPMTMINVASKLDMIDMDVLRRA